MAMLVSHHLSCSSGVGRIIESFAHSPHDAAFVRKYGHSFPARPLALNVSERFCGDSFDPLEFGYTRYGWATTAYDRLRVGMEVVLELYTTRTFSLKRYLIMAVSPSSLTVLLEVYHRVIEFKDIRWVFLFVDSPGPYMLFVGVDKFVGDLSDLPRLSDDCEMSAIEEDVRAAHYERNLEPNDWPASDPESYHDAGDSDYD